MTPTFRVSHVAQYARWREDEESDVGWLIASIKSNEETEAMRKGTAFHKALETIPDGWEGMELTSGQYRFVFTADVSISLPHTRELRKGKDYGGIVISGQADGIGGKVIIDHKTTERFDAEKYLDGWQHRFYLDIFEADQFIWNVWEMKQVKGEGDDPNNGEVGQPDTSHVYEVYGFHQLSQYRYPDLERDCQDLALDFKGFAAKFIPYYSFTPTECARAPEPPKPELKMFATRGTNVIAVGWEDGVLRVAFAGKDGAHFGRYTGVPEAEKDKLLRSPYPDRLFSTNIKSKYPYEKETA